MIDTSIPNPETNNNNFAGLGSLSDIAKSCADIVERVMNGELEASEAREATRALDAAVSKPVTANGTTPPKAETVETDDCLRETQWVVENVTRDLREHAEFFGQYKRYREWAAFMNADADLLDHAWRRLQWQLRLNRPPEPNPT